MTDLGEMKKILRIGVEKHRGSGMLKTSQGPYINIVLAQFNMQNVNLVLTPLNKIIKLTVPTTSMNTPTTGIPYAKPSDQCMQPLTHNTLDHSQTHTWVPERCM